MGFSLGKALAGFVVGAGTAAVKMYDDQFKEEAENRKRILDLEKAKEVAVFTDDLAAKREARADETKAARAVKDRESLATVVKSAKNSMPEGTKFGTPDGQFFIGEQLASAGYAEFANKFFDNGAAMQKATSDNETRKLSAEANRLYRQAQADARRDKVDEADRSVYRDALSSAAVEQRDTVSGAKIGTDTTVANIIRSNTYDLLKSNPSNAIAAASELARRASEYRASNPGVKEQAVGIFIESLIKQSRSDKKADAPPPPPANAAPAAAAATKKGPRTPGIFERSGVAGEYEPDETSAVEAPLGA